LRPGFALGILDCYINLPNKYMDKNPKSRPTALYVYKILQEWEIIFNTLTFDSNSDIRK
ncbi:5568_t:CDS:1, partial [Racocetra persica]